ncbi:DUF368 domain-containing protein [Levilactobacillus spicheri]
MLPPQTTSRPHALRGFLTRGLKGMIIALGFILPGVSGGVLAAILGLYERLLRFMAHPTKRWRSDLPFFLPVGIGGLLGIALLSAALTATATSQSARDALDWLWFGGTLVVGGLGLYFMSDLVGTLPANFTGFLVAGGLIALGVLVPGLSPSNLLLILGLFAPMLTGFKNLDLLGVYLPIALGGLLTLAVFAKGVEYLLQRYHSRVHHFILGLVVASTVLILVPNPSAAESISYAGTTVLTWVASLVACGAGIALGWWMSCLEVKYK